MIKSCFYCKISWGGKCSFTRLAFHLLSGTSLGGPDADSAQGNLLRTFPQTSSLVLRAREREAERKTPSQKCHPGTLPGTQARTHPPDAAPFPRSSL